MRILNRNAPIFLLAFFFGPAISGFYLLAHRTGSMPVELMGGTLSQSMHRNLAEARFRNAVGETVIVPVRILIQILTAPAILAALIIPDVAAFVFGAEWRMAGEMLQWLAPWLLATMIFAPMTPITAVMDWQGQAFICQTLSFVLSVGTMAILAISYDPVTAIAGYSLVNAAAICVYRLYTFHLLDVPLWRVVRPFLAQIFIFATCFGLMLVAQRHLTEWPRIGVMAALGATAMLVYLYILLRHKGGLNAVAR